MWLPHNLSPKSRAFLVIISVLMLVGGGVYWMWSANNESPVATPTPKPNAPAAVAIYANDQFGTYQDAVAESLNNQGFAVRNVDSPMTADVSIMDTKQADDDVAIGNSTIGKPAWELISEQIIEPIQQPAAYLHITKSARLISAKASLITAVQAAAQPQKGNTWTLKALGDIIPGRTVYKMTRQLKDQTAPYAKTASYTKDADLTLADLECPFSDSITHATEGMAFSAPTTAAEGLKVAGIDAVSLSNNHSYNEGEKIYDETIDTLNNYGIPYFGGGNNNTQAHTATIVTVKGIKIALLGYSSIIGSVEAGANTSGMATLSMAPWGPFAEEPVVKMEEDIRAAKTKADLVFVYYHWGTEYTHQANQDQRTVAHRAVEAGADLILGTHPHWVQGVEWYQGKLITYSLGNYVFDQEWSTETKQGVILSATFNGTQLVSASLKPYQIEDYYQPRFVGEGIGKKILGDVFSSSWWAN